MSILPIGSVVSLSGQEELVMICGIFQKNVETGETSHYIGYKYPIGVTDTGDAYMFNNSNICKLHFLGLQDAESLDYRVAVKKYFENHPEEKSLWQDF